MKINCDYCGKEFERPLWQINKNKKRDCKNYCSKPCKYKAGGKRKSDKNHPNTKSGKHPISSIQKKVNQENFIEKARDHDEDLLIEGRDSLIDEYGNTHIFPIEGGCQHSFNPEESGNEVCWCIPEVRSQGKCEECNEKHPSFLIYHSWIM